jgi:DNA-binding response OmpR family regulator
MLMYMTFGTLVDILAELLYYYPIWRNHRKPVSNMPQNTNTSKKSEKKHNKTILIIEDDTDIRNFISRVLELEGYTVLEASNGDTGMELIREHPISLVLLDLRLPGPDGWSILRTLKHHHEFSSIPVVVLTAIAESMQRKKTLRMGASQYLIKPLSAHGLSQAIAGALHEKNKHPKSDSEYAVRKD